MSVVITVQELQIQKPKIEWIEPEVTLVEYKANITLACKVSGYPKPTISWSDDTGNTFPSEVWKLNYRMLP